MYMYVMCTVGTCRTDELCISTSGGPCVCVYIHSDSLWLHYVDKHSWGVHRDREEVCGFLRGWRELIQRVCCVDKYTLCMLPSTINV